MQADRSPHRKFSSGRSDAAGTQTGRVVVFGSLNVDLVCEVAKIPRPGETVLSPRYEQYFGGKGANQAVAAARILASQEAVSMIGAVGDDALGEAVRDNLARQGIDVAAIQDAPERTGCAFIAIEKSGENAITVASGANGAIDPGRLDGDRLGTGDILVLQMEVPLAANLRAVEIAADRSARIVLNLAPVPSDLGAKDLDHLLARTEVLVVNETELAAVAELAALSEDDLLATVSRVAERFAIAVVATLGGEGLAIAEPGRASERLPAHPVDPVDTTGAGDTFVGALAAGLAEGLAIKEAARRAAVAASLSCRRLGAQSAMPTRTELEAAQESA